MNAPTHRFLPAVILLATAGLASAAGPIDVSVIDPAGKLVYKSKTSAGEVFSTGALAGGNFVVQFRAQDAAAKSIPYAIEVHAGKQKVTANGIAGSQFSGGGVGMKINVAAGLGIKGMVANMSVIGGTGNAKTKYINGKKYVWLARGGGIGSNLGGRWVEEGSIDALNASYTTADAFARLQDHGDQHQEGTPPHGPTSRGF